MLRRCVCAAALGALGLLKTFAVVAEDRRPAPDPLEDVVAVGRGPGKIILATRAKPLSAQRWRFRSISLLPTDARVQSVVLSRSGTEALVVFAGGSARVFDLTRKVETLAAGQAQAAQHHLPGQLYPVSRDEQICLMNDAGQTEETSCRTAARAVRHEDGQILYALADGSLRAERGDVSKGQSLPYRLPAAARYEMLAGERGDRRDFLVLAEQGNEVRIVDPWHAERDLGTYKSWEVAALRAVLDFGSERSGASGQAPDDATLGTLAQNLLQQALPEKYEWSFFRVKPEPALYAPVLEFAANEPAYPSDFDIWKVLNPISKGTTREEYQAAYDTLGQERFRRCSVYYRATSYPGSWLLEYWYYYPFDEGKPHPHIHDSEHIFIEVDKLGGAVRSVLASAHGSFAPNNNYSTFLPGAKVVELPLFAFVEFEKHAMSPDIDRDAKFTRGVDVNLHWERYDVWGVRDLGSKKGHLMEPYRPYMTLPRHRGDRFALANAPSYFPGLDVPAEKATCSLLPFPEAPPCKDCPVATPAAAMTHLTAHGDARRPKDIYKPWVLPLHEIRLGLGLFDHASNNSQLYAAYVVNIKHLTGGYFPFPGRLSLETMWAPTSQVFTSTANGQTITTRLSSATYFGARYERFLTNTQGFYGGFTPLFRRHASNVTGSGPLQSSSGFEYEGIWYRVGYILELPSHKKGNMTHHLGALIHGKTFRFEWHASLGLFRRHGRDNFGIRARDRNPYQ
jgi:hypothetical protein